MWNRNFTPVCVSPLSSLREMSCKPLKIKEQLECKLPIDSVGNPVDLKSSFPAFRGDLRSPRVDCVKSNLILSPFEEKSRLKGEINIKNTLPGGQGGPLCPLPQATWKTVKWEVLSLGGLISAFQRGRLFFLSFRQSRPEAQRDFTVLNSWSKGNTFLQNWYYYVAASLSYRTYLK